MGVFEMLGRAHAVAGLSVGLVALVVPVVGAGAVADPAEHSNGQGAEVRDVGPDYNDGRPLPFQSDVRQRAAEAVARLAGERAAPRLGDVRIWPALDDAEGTVYVKDFRLRAVGQNIEVWTASGRDDVSARLRFQPGDCRNGERTRITDAQVDYLVEEFDSNIFPTESVTFSVPPERNGSAAVLPEVLELPANYYRGQGDNIVVLVDNVRDSNFYDLDNTTYIGGFFFSLFNEFVDRNVMTIDGFDWLHRTGATPPDEPVPGDPCASAPARPFLYEGVFAHEYQHLLEYYEDADETTWVNEGLSLWAETLTGYVDPSLSINETGFESGIQCFLGHSGTQTPANPNPREEGGPENSLTTWGDQGADEILCDYGAAYTVMEYLRGRYGEDFMTRLHRGNANGLPTLANNLALEGTGESASDVIHQWAAMVALDEVIDGGATLNGGAVGRYTTDTLSAGINWDTPEAYSTRGAPPNGSDYVRLRSDAAPTYVAAGQINEISFDGATTLAPERVRWRIDRTPPGRGNRALYSGSGADFDRSIVRGVRVPRGNPTLTFDTRWSTERGWDFGFVQVSTDGGETYRSLGNRDTTRQTNPAALQTVKDNVPGFTGRSRGWRTERFDLSDYAGQRVLLSYRYVTDPSVNGPGWWVDNVKVGNNALSRGRSLRDWRTQTQVRPLAVEDFTVQLVAYDNAGTQAWVAELPLNAAFDGTLTGSGLTNAIGTSAQTVAAIVTYDESTETVTNRYARYSLTVNGVQQPGG